MTQAQTAPIPQYVPRWGLVEKILGTVLAAAILASAGFQISTSRSVAVLATLIDDTRAENDTLRLEADTDRANDAKAHLDISERIRATQAQITQLNEAAIRLAERLQGALSDIEDLETRASEARQERRDIEHEMREYHAPPK